jgi:type I restriction enzyme M protein
MAGGSPATYRPYTHRTGVAKAAKKPSGGATLGFEEQMWQMAIEMRGHRDVAEWKHVVLGLIFLKYVNDSFQRLHAKLKTAGDDPEEPLEYQAQNVFWLPKTSRWSHITSNSKNATIGSVIDNAMIALEKDNAGLKGILPKVFNDANMDKAKLGDLVDLVDTIHFDGSDNDVFGRVYEYFLKNFAIAEGRRRGEYFTPKCIVELLVEMLEPQPGKRIYDPCCGSGGMFVQSQKFIDAHGGRAHLAVYGQESNPTTWKLGKMNLAIRGLENDLGPRNADTLVDDLHKSVKADYVLANPPFNLVWDQDKVRDDVRWKFGVPPATNANFAWLQHIYHHLAPRGTAGVILAKGSLTGNQSGQDDIRRKLLEADAVDCIIDLPNQLFYTTQIPACLWFLAKDKSTNGHRDRRGQVLFIDARRLGVMADQTHREFRPSDIARITDVYHSWRNKGGSYNDEPGFCRTATLGEIEKFGFMLNPGRFTGSPDEPEIDSFDQSSAAILDELKANLVESQRLEKKVLDLLESFNA